MKGKYIIQVVEITDRKDKTLLMYPNGELFEGDLSDYKKKVLSERTEKLLISHPKLKKRGYESGIIS